MQNGNACEKSFKQTDYYCDFVQLSVQDAFVGTNVILWLSTPLVGISLCPFFSMSNVVL